MQVDPRNHVQIAIARWPASGQCACRINDLRPNLNVEQCAICRLQILADGAFFTSALLNLVCRSICTSYPIPTHISFDAWR
jgi:hypothetical protein